ISDRIHVPGGDITALSAYVTREAAKRPLGMEKEIVRDLIGSYGTRYVDVLKRVEADAALGARVQEGRNEILAEIAYAAGEGMAQTLADAVLRRTGIGTLGNPGGEALARCADVMGGILGWDGDRKNREVNEALQRYILAD
ncbi:glycerol-3-phosphate dehydrogenase C-terminal domain-containing protein, partial [Thermodesulfobacteriota bacterium]